MKLFISVVTILTTPLVYAEDRAGSTGFFSDWQMLLGHFLDMLSFGLSGLGVGLVLLYVLTQVEKVRVIIFPFYDELLDIAQRWRDDKTKPDDGPLAIAFAVYSSVIAFAIFYLIASLASPLG